MKATPMPEPDAPREEGLSEGMPVGGSGDEAKLLKAARTVEAAGSYDAVRREGVKSAR